MDIETLETLPTRLSSRQASDYDNWNHYRRYTVYNVVYRFLEKRVGKNVNTVYSELVEKSKNDKSFRKKMIPLTIDIIWKWYIDNTDHYHTNSFYVDNNNCIQKRKFNRRHNPSMLVNEGEPYYYKWNGRLNHFKNLFIEALGHKISEHLFNDEIPIKEFNKIDWFKVSQKLPNYVNAHIGFDTYYINRVYINKGEEGYDKLKYEERDFRRKTKRTTKKEKEEKNKNLLNDIERKRKEIINKTNIITRDRLGFNNESFKGDFYHGQKRKRKKERND